MLLIGPMGMQLRTAYLPLASQAVIVGVAWQAIKGSGSVTYPTCHSHAAASTLHACGVHRLCMHVPQKRRLAELMSQLPAEVDIEKIALNSN